MIIVRYRKENKDLEAEKQELLDTAAKSQGDLGAYQQDLAKASAQKSDLEKELSDAQVCEKDIPNKFSKK